MSDTEYSTKLKDPRWQKKRLEIFERDLWTCQKCYDSENTLVVHHKLYLASAEPWEYPDETLITLCEDCHICEGKLIDNAVNSLISAVKSKFLAESISRIAQGFEKLEKVCIEDAVADAYFYALADRELQKYLIDHVLHK